MNARVRRSLRLAAVVCASLIGWLSCACAAAQDAPDTTPPATPGAPGAPGAPEAVRVPSTPAGEHLKWFLAAHARTNPPSAEVIEARFSREFLRQVPTDQMISTMKGIRLQVGDVTLRAVQERSPTELLATLHSAKLDMEFALSVATEAAPPHRITGFLMRPMPKRVREGDTWDQIDESLEALASRVSIGAYRVRMNGSLEAVHMLNEREPMAIGSTFKLWVLAALAEEVREGRLRFEDSLAVREEWKSLPSGTMQNDPAGTEYPLSHYATWMISISDNTATDHLVHAVGRERVERVMARGCASADRNTPMLTTRDMFALKLSSDAGLTDRYLAADVDGRRAMLAGEVAKASPNLAMASFWTAPRMIDTLEWFASTEELCRTIAELAKIGSAEPGMEPVMVALSTNPGIPLDRETWPGFGYKGGSEPGVLNMTYWLLRKDGERFALSITANDPAKDVDLNAMISIVERAIGMLTKE